MKWNQNWRPTSLTSVRGQMLHLNELWCQGTHGFPPCLHFRELKCWWTITDPAGNWRCSDWWRRYDVIAIRTTLFWRHVPAGRHVYLFCRKISLHFQRMRRYGKHNINFFWCDGWETDPVRKGNTINTFHIYSLEKNTCAFLGNKSSQIYRSFSVSEPRAQRWAYSISRPSSSVVVLSRLHTLNILPETTGRLNVNFHVQHWGEGKRPWSISHDQDASMPI